MFKSDVILKRGSLNDHQYIMTANIKFINVQVTVMTAPRLDVHITAYREFVMHVKR